MSQGSPPQQVSPPKQGPQPPPGGPKPAVTPSAQESPSAQGSPQPKGPQSIDQRRAAFAWEKVRTPGKKYAGHCQKLPARILTAGLGHALLFAEKKDGDVLVRDIDEWVLKKSAIKDVLGSHETLLDLVRNGSHEQVALATDETMALLTWMKRFLGDVGKTEDSHD